MGHSIQGFVGEVAMLSRFATEYEHWHVVNLDQGFGLLLLTGELFDESVAKQGIRPNGEELEGYFMYADQAAVLGEKLSANGSVSYIETGYFGGVGSQAAVVWHRGEIVLGPYSIETHRWMHDPDTNTYKRPENLPPISEWPINTALRYLGVKKGDSYDEFEAMNLHTHRSNDGWLEKSKDQKRRQNGV